MPRQLRATVDRSVGHRLILEAAEIDLIHEERIHGWSRVWRQVNQRRQLSTITCGGLNRMLMGVSLKLGCEKIALIPAWLIVIKPASALAEDRASIAIAIAIMAHSSRPE